MIGLQSALRRKLIAAGTLVAVGLALLAALAIDSRAGAGHRGAAERVSCPRAGEPATQTTAKELRRSVRCLINQERSTRGLGEVVREHSLKQAAQAHSEVMAEADCLAHECEGEADLEERLRAAGYFDGADTWRFAENTGCGLSADAMVANWMATTFHRVNIIERRFDEIGVGVAKRRVKGPCEKDYATFAVVFGWRDVSEPVVPR